MEAEARTDEEDKPTLGIETNEEEEEETEEARVLIELEEEEAGVAPVPFALGLVWIQRVPGSGAKLPT